MTRRRLVLVGYGGSGHIGHHLARAAEGLDLGLTFCDIALAFSGPVWLRRLNWRLRDHRATRMREFEEHVLALCRDTRPEWLLVTGTAPIGRSVLEAIGRLGVERLNYLTDDPWNPAHRSAWFMDSLPAYDRLFSPRLANLDDLRRQGCRETSYLPFAYAPDVHYATGMPEGVELERERSDVVFVGGADPDRVPFLTAVASAGFALRIYGGYWDRQPSLRGFAQGVSDPRTVRDATAAARVALCLVRRANRDGHVMRSFEIPATGACMLAEDTPEHRQIFGPGGRAVIYFGEPADMLDRIAWLLANPRERERLAHVAHALILSGAHTYHDRLSSMLRLGEPAAIGLEHTVQV